jgi:hypothetical protein
MPTYKASQIIGVSMFSGKSPVDIYSLPYDNQKPIRSIAPNMPIGTVYSFLLPNASRESFFWMFYSGSNAFYVKHDPKNLIVSNALLSIEEVQEKEKGVLERIGDSFTSNGSNANTLLKIALAVALIYGGKTFIELRRKK